MRDVNESENNGCLSLCMTVKANRSIVKVELGPLMSPARSSFQLEHSETCPPFLEGRVNAVRT